MSASLSAPHNWCDSRCERCPLSRDCEVAQAEARSRRALTLTSEGNANREPSPRGRRAKSPVPSSDRPLTARASAWGTLLPESPASSAVQTHWAQTGMELVHAVKKVIESLGGSRSAAQRSACDDAASAAVLVAGKCARIASCLGPDGELAPGWFGEADAAPNLLLVERGLGDACMAIVLLSDAAEPAAVRRFWAAALELDLVLERTVEARNRAWAAVRALAGAGGAPSPFAVDGARGK